MLSDREGIISVDGNKHDRVGGCSNQARHEGPPYNQRATARRVARPLSIKRADAKGVRQTGGRQLSHLRFVARTTTMRVRRRERSPGDCKPIQRADPEGQALLFVVDARLK